MAEYRDGHVDHFGIYIPKEHSPVLKKTREQKFPTMSMSKFLGHLIGLGAKSLKVTLPPIKR